MQADIPPSIAKVVKSLFGTLVLVLQYQDQVLLSAATQIGPKIMKIHVGSMGMRISGRACTFGIHDGSWLEKKMLPTWIPCETQLPENPSGILQHGIKPWPSKAEEIH